MLPGKFEVCQVDNHDFGCCVYKIFIQQMATQNCSSLIGCAKVEVYTRSGEGSDEGHDLKAILNA